MNFAEWLDLSFLQRILSNETRHSIHTKGPEGPLCLQMVLHLSKAAKS